MSIFINLLPILVFFGLWIWISRRAVGRGMGGAMGMGKSKAKLLNPEEIKITFEDVAGVDEAKADLEEVVEFLEDPHKFERLGGKIPRGVLLVGPPGTGKTLLAKAVAGEAGVPFFHLSGSDFVEMFVGVGASRVRDMFEQAKKNAPCIIFVDEIDAVGRNRNGGSFGGGNDEREQTLNALLVEMDGFNDNEGIIIIAATNRVDVLDPALLRPGRFDRQVTVSNPDITGREKILKVHTRNVPLGADVDLKVVARGTPGFSGADLANLINEAALMAARRSKRIVTALEFEDARDKILMGAERRTLLMTDEEKKMTAYHEGGHALVSLKMEGSIPIHKATIIPRGRALGMVQSLPERDQISQSYKEMIAHLAMAMGGRAAEELVFGSENVTSGAAADIQQASKIARAMVTQLGFSAKLGKVAYTEPNSDVFHGPKVAEETQKTIDDEVRGILDDAYYTAYTILKKNRKELDTLAKGLLEYETLSGQEILDLLDGKVPLRD
jgi:cell division protease FtsH